MSEQHGKCPTCGRCICCGLDQEISVEPPRPFQPVPADWWKRPLQTTACGERGITFPEEALEILGRGLESGRERK